MADNNPDEELVITMLGAGQEVGRSCHLIEFKVLELIQDMGIHPGINGLNGLPFMDYTDPDKIDILLISHFHLDHCGGLPWFLTKTQFKGRVFMTYATKAIYRWLLSDYIKVSNVGVEELLFTEKDLEETLDRIETVKFHAEKHINGIKFCAYHAGHVLGAAQFMVEIAGVKVLFTGDFSREEDRHLMAAEVPPQKPDILIMESTYGTHLHEKREEREHRFTSVIHDIINRGGRCLIPVFALGRAQELLLILDDYWAQHPELHDIPIYYASTLAKKCMSVYQTYTNAMNSKIQKAITTRNPFQFRHISNLKGMEAFDDDIGPSVVLASPGMMQSGLSRELFEKWCTNKRNGVILAGYAVEGTLAHQIKTEPDEIVTMSGQKLPLKMQVEYMSFSAHADYRQISEFVREIKPPHIVLVHGEANEMGRLKRQLDIEYEHDAETDITIHMPRNAEKVKFHFRGEKNAKVVGSLAHYLPKQEDEIEGILVRKNFNYKIVAAEDLKTHAELETTQVKQRLSVDFNAPADLLKFYLEQLSYDVKEFAKNTKCGFIVFRCIRIVYDEQNNMVILEWKSTPTADAYADSVLAMVIRVDTEAKVTAKPQIIHPDGGEVFLQEKFEMKLRILLETMYGDGTVEETKDGDVIILNANKQKVEINVKHLTVECEEDGKLMEMVQETVHRLYSAVMPIPTQSLM
ncbi:unnamed protein product [Oikopleura dioica]|uniref:Cleavage and polyadenylation specificity factor subunit 3 n=1 Tax=Oikopleura dioica TaxID=34765 RepID=E4YQL1_OIKDI|nr:unnamed protein product [Oikopleura dioica]